jgi:PAS domain S-box-containing protein
MMVGLGMLLIMTITILSLENIAGDFSRTTRSVSQISREVRKLWDVEQRIGDAARMIRQHVSREDPGARRNYEMFHAAAAGMLEEIRGYDLPEREQRILASLINDFRTIEAQADRIFALDLGNGKDQAVARKLAKDVENLVAWMDHDVELYKEENAVRLQQVARDLEGTKVRIYLLFGVILFTTIGFLLAFGVYLYQKVSMPLGQLWAGAEAVSAGNLDYHVQVRGQRDIEKLAERFNEMASKLKASHADLEHRLLERTKQLAALNSVSLTLGGRGSLSEVLQRSLATVLESFPDMEARGGVFLCEPGGETLRLAAHRGLPAEFVEREQRIRRGECLCGSVAQTGEMVFSEQGCAEPHAARTGGPGQGHIIVPIKSRGAVLGVMFLYPSRPFTLKPSDVQLFDTVGAQLGMAVENLRFYSEVKETSEKYWDLFEKSRDVLFTVDLEGRLSSVNEAAERFAGRTKRELIGMNVLRFLNDEGRELVRRIMAGSEPMEGRVFEFEIRKADGTRAFLEVNGRVLTQNGRAAGFHAAARDITEQKNLRELLVQAERLAAIGQIVVAVRHEINNPLTTVIGNTELLLERYEHVGADLKKRLETVLDNALRISEIVKRLQGIKQERTVEYVQGVKMTDLGRE